METRRAQENDEKFKPICRGWCLGDERFRHELLERAQICANENHFAQTRIETAEEKARRIMKEEMDRLGWQAHDLAGRAKGDVGKVRIAQRLRQETSVTLKWIAEELQMGSWTHVSNLLLQTRDAADDNQLRLV